MMQKRSCRKRPVTAFGNGRDVGAIQNQMGEIFVTSKAELQENTKYVLKYKMSKPRGNIIKIFSFQKSN